MNMRIASLKKENESFNKELKSKLKMSRIDEEDPLDQSKE